MNMIITITVLPHVFTATLRYGCFIITAALPLDFEPIRVVLVATTLKLNPNKRSKHQMSVNLYDPGTIYRELRHTILHHVNIK